MISFQSLSAAAGILLCQIASGAPNIVFIFIDDIGWGDMSCYRDHFGITPDTDDKSGNPITPNLDALSGQGMWFTDGYVVSPVCSPSRVGVLTGIEPCRFAIHDYLDSKNVNDSRNMNDWLDPNTVSAARWFQKAGYATGMFGKWHMGGGRDVNNAPFPQDYGFDSSLTSFEGMGDRILYLDDGVQHGLSLQNADVPGSIEWVEWELGADKHTDAAIAFITNAVNQGKPFYVHVPHDDTHAPYDTDPGKENDFDHVTTNTNGKLFLSELHELDKEIGRLVNAIDALGVADETLIVVVGDNGAPEDTINTILNRNGGLRGGKKRLWEGGIREPFLIRMPGTVPAGVVNSTTAVSTLDLFPTYCALAGLPLPDAPFAGENMLDVFTGANRPRRRPLFWEFSTNPNIVAAGPKLAMREGNYKLLRDPDGSNRHLFDLSSNREEDDALNLINDPSRAEMIASMEDRLMAWYREAVLGQFATPHAGIAERGSVSGGGTGSVRLYWETAGGEWLPPQISNDLSTWTNVAFDPSDAEIDHGTLRWLDMEIPNGYENRAFFRGPAGNDSDALSGTPVYLVSSSGEIRRFTGISTGTHPMAGFGLGAGELVNTVASYGSYQGFTQTPAGAVYGVASNGDVHEWADVPT
ncbi:MAG: sulfatase-like hydrolase/transferase, partial [Verrucomicrobiae bacterium]|nr:sulfatase-like hydrolase/transferase [Verrucomicrobiae bacterium]